MSSGTVTELKLAEISPAPDNPRRKLGDLSELISSLGELGLLQPLVVTPRNGNYMVVCGHRRHAAAKKAKLTTVPVVVRDLDEPQRIKAMVIENCQRSDLSPIEEARAYQQLVGLGVTQRQLADDVGKGQSHISKRLSLLALPPKVLKDVDSGGITIGDAIELAKLVDHPDALATAVKRISFGWRANEAVRQQLAEIELQKKGEAEIERIKAAGIRYIASKDDYTAPKGTMYVDPDRSWDSLPMKIGAHSKLPCHAATVGRNGARRYLCTDPKSHAGDIKEAKQRATKDAAAERRRAHDKEIREATRARRAKISEILQERIPKDELIEQLVSSLIRETWQSKRKIACELLGIDADGFGQVKRSDGYGFEEKWEQALKAEAAKPGRAGAVGLALVFAATEETISKAWDGWQRHGAYFDWLAQHGYESTPAEKRELAGKAPR